MVVQCIEGLLQTGCPYAHLADWFIYKTETEEGHTLFLVDASSPGVGCSQLKTIASDIQCQVDMDKVKGGRENMPVS